MKKHLTLASIFLCIPSFSSLIIVLSTLATRRKSMVLAIFFFFIPLTLDANKSYYYKGGEGKINMEKSKFSIAFGLGKNFFFSPYDSTISLWELPKNGTSMEGEFSYLPTKNLFFPIGIAYIHRLILRYHSDHPMDRLWFLRFISVKLGISAGISQPLGLPVTPYLGLGVDICKAENIADFLNGRYLVKPLPLTLGVQSFGGVCYVVHAPFTIDINIHSRWLTVRGEEKEIYNLRGLYLGIKIGYNWK